MDSNLYALQAMAAGRLADARAEACRRHLVARTRGARRPLRARLGTALVAVGEWLRREPVLAPAAPR